MALKLLSQTHLLRAIPISSFSTPPILLHRKLLLKPLSICATRYPFHYELIDFRPTKSSLRRPNTPLPKSSSEHSPDEKSKRKYLHKRRRKMYGTDYEDEAVRGDREGGFVELEPVVMEFKSVHHREEELFFYDTFAYPWEKKKHYKMMYQLEKKYFPDQCLDRAFLEPGEEVSGGGTSRVRRSVKVRALSRSDVETEERNVNEDDDKGLVFFEEEKVGEIDKAKRGLGNEEGKGMVNFEGGKVVKDVKKEILGTKVADLFKSLKKVPSRENGVAVGEPYLLTRSRGLPARWDGPYGTVVLVNKPKGMAFLEFIFSILV